MNPYPNMTPNDHFIVGLFLGGAVFLLVGMFIGCIIGYKQAQSDARLEAGMRAYFRRNTERRR